MPTLKIKKLVPDLPTPEVKTAGAAGVDLYCAADTTVKAGTVTKVPLGVAIDYPDGYMGILAARSSLPAKKGVFVVNGVGIIDSDYRGEHMIQLCPLGDNDVMITKGERIAQVVLTPVLNRQAAPVTIAVVAELDATARGDGAFGSTGHD